VLREHSSHVVLDRSIEGDDWSARTTVSPIKADGPDHRETSGSEGQLQPNV
jgi:hypothetical protein